MVPGLPNQRQGHGNMSKKAREEPPFGLSVWVCLLLTDNQDLKVTDLVPVSPAGLQLLREGRLVSSQPCIARP